MWEPPGTYKEVVGVSVEKFREKHILLNKQ